jgi:hypothetical protein
VAYNSAFYAGEDLTRACADKSHKLGSFALELQTLYNTHIMLPDGWLPIADLSCIEIIFVCPDIRIQIQLGPAPQYIRLHELIETGMSSLTVLTYRDVLHSLSLHVYLVQKVDMSPLTSACCVQWQGVVYIRTGTVQPRRCEPPLTERDSFQELEC